ncbi:MAG: PilN domain-containing protein [Phycisphaerales bacterium]|jgi:Tfp pilus assembly protein PilN|nr:PilN domain-containing protein [Phycisphaerales bacterium]
MRELEFLPDWYPRIFRRRRLVMLQAWMVLVFALGLAAWSFLCGRNVQTARAELSTLKGDMSQTDMDLKKLDQLLELKRQWRLQDQVIARLGVHVPSARLIAALESVMPPEMALLNLSVDTVEQPRTVAKPNGKSEIVVDRQIKIRMLGVAPTDLDLANFMTRLTSERYFEQVSMSYAKERQERGHIMREFEVVFSVNLNIAGGNVQ